jgi:hypothetical protein
MKNALFLFLVLLISSCTKIEDIIVGDNTLPPDYTIENTTIENYINKLYISTISREPTEAEFTTDFNLLRNANLSQKSREIVIDGILNKSEYSFNLFTLESANILNSVDTAMINERISSYQQFLLVTTNFLDSIYVANELERMLTFQNSLTAFYLGTTTITELYRAMANNIFFDEINMGTENFVVAMFQHFLSRYPTDSELESAKDMVDDKNATLFFETGNGKNDFLDIFFTSNEYFTGQTNILFNRYLFRNPSSEESVNYSLDYINTGDYKSLQKRILSSEEFIGL